MSKSYPITGIPVRPGEPTPARRELSSWSISTTREDQIQVSLCIRALRQLEEKDPLNDELSFYRIAGIHGLPKVPWDNEGDGSYCPHNAFTFPTWHRPYMLLYEQCLYNIMKDIIKKNIQDQATRDEWMKAAQRWRLPFWEWALPQVDTKDFGVPNIVNDSKVEILKLDGQGKETVANPLTQYYNKLNNAGVPMGDQKMGKFAINYERAKQFNRCIGTSRYGDPNQATWVDGVQNNSSITTALKNPDWGTGRPKKSIAENVFRILTYEYFQSYGRFSTTRYYREFQPRPTEWLSLEQIHNNIHDWAGGEGHMAYVPVASFDPIFWLHHCNVDRLLAIWQYLNPDKWFDNTWADDDHTKPFDPSKPLPPFHSNAEKKLYSSNDTQYWEPLGYTYPELLKTNVDQLNKTLIEKYGRGITQLKEKKVDGGQLPKGIDLHCFQDYVINVEYDRFALNGEPYKVAFHVKAEDRPGKIGETRHLGSFFNFVAPGLPDCSNCAAQQQSGVKSKAQVPITLPLHGLVTDPGYPDAENLEQEHVEVLLERELRWTVSKLSGEEVPLTEVPGLLVTVYGGESGYPTDESLATFKPDTYRPLWGATDGKQCGATRAAA